MGPKVWVRETGGDGPNEHEIWSRTATKLTAANFENGPDSDGPPETGLRALEK